MGPEKLTAGRYLQEDKEDDKDDSETKIMENLKNLEK